MLVYIKHQTVAYLIACVCMCVCVCVSKSQWHRFVFVGVLLQIPGRIFNWQLQALLLTHNNIEYECMCVCMHICMWANIAAFYQICGECNTVSWCGQCPQIHDSYREQNVILNPIYLYNYQCVYTYVCIYVQYVFSVWKYEWAYVYLRVQQKKKVIKF